MDCNSQVRNTMSCLVIFSLFLFKVIIIVAICFPKGSQDYQINVLFCCLHEHSNLIHTTTHIVHKSANILTFLKYIHEGYFA